ncbi:MAG: DUF4430 domain-containing protein [Solirubrobacteraceae bacterium]|nr:DUF4430 domain-containing protein [Solirubrobacteraceae bacterium]
MALPDVPLLRHGCRTTFLVLAVLALVAPGCGAGPGQEAGNVQLLVTEGFGEAELLRVPAPERGDGDSIVDLLRANAKVELDGDTVVGVRGKAAADDSGWFAYVNGVAPDEAPAKTDLEDGARIWWDLHRRGIPVRAVVGAYPEPFRTGLEGRRFPLRIECSDVQSKACDQVAAAFSKLGIVAARGGLGTTAGEETLRVLVGRWSKLRSRDEVAESLAGRPGASGVFAQFADGGRTLVTFDAAGRPVQRLGAGTGLVAAGRIEHYGPTWLVTGTDDAGVDSAVLALDESALDSKFALAVSENRGIALPENPGTG